MKKYKDVFGKPITKSEVRTATLIAIKAGNAETMTLSRQMGIGYGKAQKISRLLYDAGVIVDSTFKGTTILLKKEDTAINAALRQLKRGNKA